MGLDLVGKRLKAVREKQGQSHEDVAGVLGLEEEAAIAQVEAGERNLTAEELFKLITHFGVDLEYFTDPFRLEEGEAQWHWNTSSGHGETEDCHLWPDEEPEGAVTNFEEKDVTMPKHSAQDIDSFLSACLAVRDAHPSITVAGLHTMLTVAASGKPMGYAELGEIIGLPYAAVTAHAGLLSDGRGSKPGTFWLERVPGRNRQEKNLILSEDGREISALFEPYMQGPSAEETPIFKVLSKVVKDVPVLNLSAFAIVLGVHSLQSSHNAKNQKAINDFVPSKNMSRLIEKLSSSEIGLLSVVKSKTDRRVNLVSLSEKGKALISEIEETLFAPAEREAPVVETQDQEFPEFSP